MTAVESVNGVKAVIHQHSATMCNILHYHLVTLALRPYYHRSRPIAAKGAS